MSQLEKLFLSILMSAKGKSIPFSDLCKLLIELGFECRQKGSHHIFYRDEVEEIINLQSLKGKAKPYQVKQVRNIILKYRERGVFDCINMK